MIAHWLCKAAAGLCFVGAVLGAVQAQPIAETDLAPIVNAMIEAKAARPALSCGRADGQVRPGLTIVDGIVTAADLIGEIGGYAGAAATTGGLGGRLRVVTTLRDYNPEAHEVPIPGSLRQHLESVVRERAPAWIVFDPELGPGARLEVKSTLRIPSDVTIDGSCADITLEAPNDSKTMFAYIASGTSNVILARLAMRKTGYVPDLNRGAGSAIRVNGNFDRVAIVHNDLAQCGDGCIDITVSPNKLVPHLARITVAFNFVRDHDKVMLFGTFDCKPIGDDYTCDETYLMERRFTSPGLWLTLEGNLFARTGQRHPRIYGNVAAHVLNNVVAFQPLLQASGAFGSSYGIFVANGARALIEENVFLPLMRRGSRPPLAVWTVRSPGALQMPDEVEGFIRLGRNSLYGDSIATEFQPAEVRDPGYSYHSQHLVRLSPKAAIACVADRAGRTGSSKWNPSFCL